MRCENRHIIHDGPHIVDVKSCTGDAVTVRLVSHKRRTVNRMCAPCALRFDAFMTRLGCGRYRVQEGIQ